MGLKKSSLLTRDPKTIARWVRLHFRTRIDGFARAIIRLKHVCFHSRTDRSRRKAHDKAIEHLSALINRCSRNRYHSTETLANSALYIILTLRDIEAFKFNAVFANDAWSRQLCLRTIILTCCEFDTKKLNRNLIEALRNLSVDSEKENALLQEMTRLRKQHQKFQQKYKSIRNELIAHRIQDSYAYLRRVRTLSGRDVLTDCADLLANTETVISVFSDILKQYGNIEALRRVGQIKASDFPVG